MNINNKDLFRFAKNQIYEKNISSLYCHNSISHY
jgi:hypothetical protein